MCCSNRLTFNFLRLIVSYTVLAGLLLSCREPVESAYTDFQVNLKTQLLEMYWKDDQGQLIGSFERLDSLLDKRKHELVFATNGGMFQSDNVPVGLYIENGQVLQAIDHSKGEGNFYLLPNAVFLTRTDGTAAILPTDSLKTMENIRYATQSGPLLLNNGKIHTAFNPGSDNVQIRNGVGILDDTHLLFSISKHPVRFYDFANHFKELGCKNALYLDGFVSGIYLPQQDEVRSTGSYGVIIAVTRPK